MKIQVIKHRFFQIGNIKGSISVRYDGISPEEILFDGLVPKIAYGRIEPVDSFRRKRHRHEHSFRNCGIVAQSGFQCDIGWGIQEVRDVKYVVSAQRFPGNQIASFPELYDSTAFLPSVQVPEPKISEGEFQVDGPKYDFVGIFPDKIRIFHICVI
jgi:hypothetical protein